MKTLSLCAAMLLSLSLQAQPHLSRNHYMGTGIPTPPSTSPTAYPYDVKNFSLMPLNNAHYEPENIYISAATAFLNDGLNKGIYFTSFAGDGSVLRCGAPGTMASFLYDDPNYSDERAVAIQSRYSTDGSDVVIMCQVKDNTGRHGIKFLFINHCNGYKARDVVVFLPTSFTGQGIHPLDFIYDPSTQEYYICGYMQDDATGLNRHAFLAKLDDNTLAFGIFWVMSWTTGVSPTTRDYDMAIRIKKLTRGPNAGRILVLGGSNVVTASANHSGSLAMIFNSTLSGLISSTSISNTILGVDDIKDEYAYDATEDNNGNLHIYSNTFVPNPGSPIGDYHPNSRYMMVTRTDTALRMSTTLNGRAIIGNIYQASNWGKNVIANNVVAGYQSFWDASRGCTLRGIAPSANNITPFFAQMTPLWNPGTGFNLGITYWKLYHTQTPPTTFFSSLGGVPSNISWPTKFATDNIRMSGNTDMMAVAPIMNSTLPTSSPANKLAYKFIRTDNIGNMDPSTPNTCDNIYTNCAPPVKLVVPFNYEPTSTFSGFATIANVTTGASVRTDTWVNDSLGCNLNGYYRPTGVNELFQSDAVKIYPNPTYDLLNVEFNSTSNEAVKIYIYNVSGQKVLEQSISTNIGNNKIPLSISNLANGNYLLELRNGAEVTRQLITKQ